MLSRRSRPVSHQDKANVSEALFDGGYARRYFGGPREPQRSMTIGVPTHITRRAQGPAASRLYGRACAVVDEETETLEMFTHNEGARNEVIRVHKSAELTNGAGKSLAAA